MQSGLDIWFTVLDMSHSPTTGYFPHCALVLHHSESTTFSSQLEAHLQPMLVEQFPENLFIIEQSGARTGPRQCP
jgi:hypothetical protein